MRLLHYLEIENFKCFGGRQRVELDHPAVLIGPNNCGKTSAVQALALWSQAVKTWYDVRHDGQGAHRHRAEPAQHCGGAGAAHPLFLAQRHCAGRQQRYSDHHHGWHRVQGPGYRLADAFHQQG